MNPHINLKTGSVVELEVTPVYEIFYRDGYGIYNTKLENGLEIVIKGNFPLPLNLQQIYEVKGTVVLRKFDKQIDVSAYRFLEPKGLNKVITYLQQLKGLKKRAEKIYDVFGNQSIKVLKKEPERVAESIKGISEKMAKKWQEELLSIERKEKDMLFLLELGLSSKQANELINNYGSNIQMQIKENPYILLSVNNGGRFGFLKCDALAKKIGFDFGHPERVKEGLIHCLKEAGKNGHTFLPKEKLVESMEDTLNVTLTYRQMLKVLHDSGDEIKIHSRTFKIDRDDLEKRIDKMKSLKRESAREKYRYPLFQIEEKHVERALDELDKEGRIQVHFHRVALSWYEDNEIKISEDIFRLSKTEKWKNSISIEKELDRYLKSNGIDLEDKQREAVIRFSEKSGGVYLLLGSAGTGKSFTLKIILAMLEKVYKANKKPFEVKVLTPTGKAAKVAKKYTGFDTETIHRGLEYNPETGFQRNQFMPLEATVLVVDESSMMDAPLAASLFEAVETGIKVILMGDVKQLPSVGPGNVLRDLANSDVVEKVTLEVVKRQGALSGIIKNANRIIKGQMMKTYEDTKDAYIIHEDDDEIIRNKTIASIKRLLSFPDYTLDDIQVLVPQRRGTLGVYELNKLIQQYFNPHINSSDKIRNIKSDKTELYFYKGDKIIHTRNNYNKVWYTKTTNGYQPQNNPGITNGETGVIEDIDTVFVNEDGKVKKKKRIIVRYEDGYVFYHEGDDIKEIDHAYCLSIHKSQGSQWKAVIIPISKQHAYFLDRNLIYTAWTRSELFGAVIGPKRILAIAIKKDKSIERYTQLQNFILQEKQSQVI